MPPRATSSRSFAAQEASGNGQVSEACARTGCAGHGSVLFRGCVHFRKRLFGLRPQHRDMRGPAPCGGGQFHPIETGSTIKSWSSDVLPPSGCDAISASVQVRVSRRVLIICGSRARPPQQGTSAAALTGAGLSARNCRMAWGDVAARGSPSFKRHCGLQAPGKDLVAAQVFHFDLVLRLRLSTQSAAWFSRGCGPKRPRVRERVRPSKRRRSRGRCSARPGCTRRTRLLPAAPRRCLVSRGLHAAKAPSPVPDLAGRLCPIQP